MTVDAFLSQRRILVRRIENKAAHLRQLEEQKDAVMSLWGEHRGTNTHDAPYVRILERIEALRSELEADRDALLLLTGQMMDLLYALPEERMKDVLVLRYLEGKSYQEIGDCLHIDKGTAKRWQTRALGMLELPEQPVRITPDILQRGATECNGMPT